MRELTTQTGIVVKCSKTAIEFFQNAQSVDFFSVLEIPEDSMKRTKEIKALRVAALRAFLLVTVSCSVWAVAV